MQNNKSQKEVTLDGKLQKLVDGIVERLGSADDLPQRVITELLEDEGIKAIQDYANTVSITRLGLNDHGPVHMRTVCKNAMKMLDILHEAGVETSLQKEHSGSFVDSVVAVMLAAFLHDAGMTIGRKDHELYSGIIAYQILTDILLKVLPDDVKRRTIIRSMAMEGILGHMGTHPIHSIEAGLILIADGCDMTKDRARIALEIPTKPMEGDIHKYSANSIENIQIVGSGGNINKLYRLTPKRERKSERLLVSTLSKLHAHLSALSVEQRMEQYELREDRVDVIVPAAQLFLMVSEVTKAESIMVPTVGLTDGVINELAEKI